MKKIRFKDNLISYLEKNNITNKEFANRIDITPKHLIDILAGTRDLSTQIIENISMVTEFSIEYIYDMEMNYKFEEIVENYLKKQDLTITKYLNKYAYKDLINEKFIDFKNTEDKMEILKDILKYLRVPTPDKVYEIDKFYNDKTEKLELTLLWLEKCFRETLKQTVKKYKKENINNLIKYISSCAKEGIFNEQELVQKFNDNGIYLVIQNDIFDLNITGAFKVHKGIPAIYLTLKSDRIVDIYFNLFQGLARCKSDLNKAQAMSIITYDNDECEQKIENQVYNWMVDDDYYLNVCSRKYYDIENEKKYPKAFVACRLAKNKIISHGSEEYKKYNIIVK